MKKLVRGVLEFRQKLLPDYRATFARLALGQAPDTLFIACSDSRVAANVFASTNPGDMFVVRNVGNLIPCCGSNGHSMADESEAAAIEFALLNLNVSDIIICGHSECGAMNALVEGREKLSAPNLRAWLRHGEGALEQLDPARTDLSQVNQLSQLNVLHQMEHLLTYPTVSQRVSEKKLKIHGWWFELSTASVYAYEEDDRKFQIIDEQQAERILAKLEAKE